MDDRHLFIGIAIALIANIFVWVGLNTPSHQTLAQEKLKQQFECVVTKGGDYNHGPGSAPSGDFERP